MVDQELTRTGEEIREATEPLPLARAREESKYWQWIAERRDSQRYGQKQEVSISIDLGSALQRIVERKAITGQSVPVLDVASTQQDGDKDA
jgi:hypothetical protein